MQNETWNNLWDEEPDFLTPELGRDPHPFFPPDVGRSRELAADAEID